MRKAWGIRKHLHEFRFTKVSYVIYALQVWEAELKQHGSVKRLKSLMAGKGRGAAARSLADLAKADDMVDL